MQGFQNGPYSLVVLEEELLNSRIVMITCLHIHNDPIVVSALNLVHNGVNKALVGRSFINIFRLLLRSPGICRAVGHHSDGEINQASFAMHELHYIIHAEATGHAVIMHTINELPGGGINPTGADYSSIGVCARRLKVGLHTSLAIAPDNPAQRGEFTIHEARRAYVSGRSLVLLGLD